MSLPDGSSFVWTCLHVCCELDRTQFACCCEIKERINGKEIEFLTPLLLTPSPSLSRRLTGAPTHLVGLTGAARAAPVPSRPRWVPRERRGTEGAGPPRGTGPVGIHEWEGRKEGKREEAGEGQSLFVCMWKNAGVSVYSCMCVCMRGYELACATRQRKK